MYSEELILITIITEAVLESRLVEELRKSGARGYMISNVRGESWRGVRTADWSEAHIRLEAIADKVVADQIATILSKDYLPYYAMMTYQTRLVITRSDESLPRPIGDRAL